MKYADCLPVEISQYVKTLQNVRELRLRDGNAAKINVGGRWFFVGKNRLCGNPQEAVQLGEICDGFVKKACNQSVFAYEKMLAQGFFTMSDGTRVGVCGEMGAGGVFKRYTSLCVRTARHFACVGTLPSENTVVAGAPGSGKTTFLRDFAIRASQSCNVAVVDERGEISSCEGFSKLSLCDVFRFTPKSYAFEVAVRTMSPDWIVCDELGEADFPRLDSVAASGVKLIAALHATSESQLLARLGSHAAFFSTAVFLEKGTFAQRRVNLQNLITR